MTTEANEHSPMPADMSDLRLLLPIAGLALWISVYFIGEQLAANRRVKMWRKAKRQIEGKQ